MKAQDLRIGNSVYYNGTNGPIKNENKIDALDIHLMDQKPEYLALHSPIPLIKEKLLEFGFTKIIRNDNIFKIDIVWFEKDGHRVYLLPNGFEFELKVSNELFNLGSKKWKYVHQLQNLWFALTGKELTINK